MRGFKIIPLTISFIFLFINSALAGSVTSCASTQESPLAVQICKRVSPVMNVRKIPEAVDRELMEPSLVSEWKGFPTPLKEGASKRWIESKTPEVESVPDERSAYNSPGRDLVVLWKF